MKSLAILGCLLLTLACTTDSPDHSPLMDIAYEPAAFPLQVELKFPQMEIPADNPLTVEGVALGRRLFYDPILSLDSTISCGSCHFQELAFTDRRPVGVGVGGTLGTRSAMSLLNVGFHQTGLFWDGRAATLEEQALIPVEDSLEMKESWPNVVKKLARHSEYPVLFRKAFGIIHPDSITKELTVKAIAQFERSLWSSPTSKYDLVKNGLASFTEDEAMGEDLFFDITADVKDAECGNCHNAPLFTTSEFANNGLDAVSDINAFEDKGRGAISKDRYDNGKFKIPTLRNIALTAPYMHDGRFSTLEEVLAHYNKGGNASPTVHPIIRPLGLSDLEQQQIIAFLHTLTDTAFVQNGAYSDPIWPVIVQ